MDADITTPTPDQTLNSNVMPSDDEVLTLDSDLLARLMQLCQLDIDTIFAYDQAIEEIDAEHGDIRRTLDGFREDHIVHVLNLSNVIFGFGGEPPDVQEDFQGFAVEGFTTVEAAAGTVGALKAMRTDEALTNQVYAEALSWAMPEGLRSLIEEHREDERRHMSFVVETLARLGIEGDETTGNLQQEPEAKTQTLDQSPLHS